MVGLGFKPGQPGCRAYTLNHKSQRGESFKQGVTQQAQVLFNLSRDEGRQRHEMPTGSGNRKSPGTCGKARSQAAVGCVSQRLGTTDKRGKPFFQKVWLSRGVTE